MLKALAKRCAAPHDQSPNVRRVMAYNLLDGAAGSIWNTLLPLFVYSMTKNNTWVGWTTAVSGIAQVFAAAIGGFYADKIPRQFVARVGALCGMTAAAMSLAALYLESLGLLLAGAVGWGFYWGLANPASEALFADSVASGRRTRIYSLKWAIQLGSALMGYFVSLVLFLNVGNHWGVGVLQVVLSVGFALHPLAMSLLFLLKDKDALVEPTQGAEVAETSSAVPTGATGEECDTIITTPLTDKRMSETPSTETPAAATPVPEPRVVESPAVETAVVAIAVVETPSVSVAVPQAEGPVTEPASITTVVVVADSVSKPTDSGVPSAISSSRVIRSVRKMVSVREVRSETRVRREDSDDADDVPGAHTDERSPMVSGRSFTGTSFASRARRHSTIISVSDYRQVMGDTGAPRSPVASSSDSSSPDADDAVNGAASAPAGPSGGVVSRTFCGLTWRHVPYLIVSGDLLQALGAGMTMRYFMLFFANDFGMTPIALMLISITGSIAAALVSMANQSLAKRFFGRVPMVLLARLLGTGLLYFMALAKEATLAELATAFTLRWALMNSVMGMTRSVIMDCVPKQQRAKWSAMESVSSLSWSGSAVIGGYLVEAHGYRYSFIITAIIHTLASAVVLPAAFVIRDPEAPTASRSA